MPSWQDGHSDAALAAGAAAGLGMCQHSLDFPVGKSSLEVMLKYNAEGTWCLPEGWGFCTAIKAVSAPVGSLQEYSASGQQIPAMRGCGSCCVPP